MAEPMKCPRCGTEGCVTFADAAQMSEYPRLAIRQGLETLADIACSLRALNTLLESVMTQSEIAVKVRE